MARKRRKAGRPPKPMPDQISDTPENVALALMTSPPRKPDDWEYLRQAPKAEPAGQTGSDEA